MNYVPLNKVYYKSKNDTQKYFDEYESRFNSPDTVKINFHIGEHQAFFMRNYEVMDLAFKIARLDKKVGNLAQGLPGVARSQFSKKCMIDEIVVTNKIEGVHSSRKEISDVLETLEKQSGVKRAENRFKGLVNKYDKLMSRENIKLEKCEDIRNLYDELFLSEVTSDDPKNAPDGKIFRKGPESVYGPTGKELHRGIYPEEKIISCMQDAITFLNDDSVEELFRICVFHYLVEYIHPFYDGNGRMGRFIFSYCISKYLEPLLAYRISEVIKENIKLYYDAFELCNDFRSCGDVTPFLIMQLEMVYKSLIYLEDALSTLTERLEKYQQIIFSLPMAKENNMVNLYYLLVQAALFSERGITANELSNCMNVSVLTVRRMVGKIPEIYLKKRKLGKAFYYELDLEQVDMLIFQLKNINRNC